MPVIADVRTEILPDLANPQLLVHVVDDAGGFGVGETWWGHYRPELAPGAPVRAIAAFVDDLLSPTCIGHDARDIAGLWDRLHRASYQYGLEGIVSTAIAGVDLALWDLAGRRAGVPTADLLGRRHHDRLPAYASLTWLGDGEWAAFEARRAIRAGFRAVKLHEHDPDVVLAVRRSIGADPDLMLDVSARWTEADTPAMAERLAEADLVWIEEPVFPPQDHDVLRRLAAVVPQRLAAGENEFGPTGFAGLVAAGVTVLQPDLVKAGGLTPARVLDRMIGERDVWLCPHNFSLGPSLGANIHWAMTAESARWIEVPFLPEAASFPGSWSSPTLDADGCVPYPTGPGLTWA